MASDNNAHIKIIGDKTHGFSVLTEWATTMKEFESHDGAVKFAKANDPDDWGQIWDAPSGTYLPKGETGITDVDSWDRDNLCFYKHIEA